jgi:DnaK suppressor protein
MAKMKRHQRRLATKVVSSKASPQRGADRGKHPGPKSNAAKGSAASKQPPARAKIAKRSASQRSPAKPAPRKAGTKSHDARPTSALKRTQPASPPPKSLATPSASAPASRPAATKTAVTRKGAAPMPPAKAHAAPLNGTTHVASGNKSLVRAAPHVKGTDPAPLAPRAAALSQAVPPVKNGKAMSKKPKANISAITLPAGYRPSDSEPFMGPMQRAYFHNKLLQWKEDIIKQNRETLQVLHDDTLQHSDMADRANSEAERALELRARDRQRKLVAKIDAAVARIEDGSYGYCEDTGEPISLKRLDARPIATLSLEAQERHERREKVFRED